MKEENHFVRYHSFSVQANLLITKKGSCLSSHFEIRVFRSRNKFVITTEKTQTGIEFHVSRYLFILFPRDLCRDLKSLLFIRQIVLFIVGWLPETSS